MAATVEKTVHYALPMIGQSANINTGTTYTDSADTTIYIPETTSRTFKKVIAEIHLKDCATTLYAFAAIAARFSCDAGSNWTSLTKTVAMTNTGENCGYVIYADITAEFTARFSGASDTLRWGCYLSLATNTAGVSMFNGASCVVHITYEYDHTAHSTRLRSVLLPIESTTTATTATLAEIGTNQWPNLDNLLPEASKSYRQVALVLDCDYVSAGTTDTPVALAFDSEAETAFGTLESANRSDGHMRYTWIRNDLATNATHALKWRHTAGGALQRGGGYLIVNYEYDASQANDCFVSLQMPFNDDWINSAALASGDREKCEMSFYIEEGATISLKQSAVLFNFDPTTGGANNESIICGGQSARAYSIGSAQQTEPLTIYQRIDSGGAQGAGITLARGKNTLTCEMYAATTYRNYCTGKMLFLNYTCAKGNGDHEHNHTLWHIFEAGLDGGTAVDAMVVLSAPTAINITPANYWLNNVGFDFCWTQNANPYNLGIGCERAAGEGPAAGWQTMYATGYSVNGERHSVSHYFLSEWFKQYPNDPRYGRMNIETARDWRYMSSNSGLGNMLMLVTLHHITVTKSGTLSGYADADGAGLSVYLVRDDTGERVDTATTTAGGNFSFTWYDNTIDVYSDCWEDATHVGRSNKGTS
jgi:hypothetical protein